MTYKVMGITAGRKNSNSEILLKEALMACEEAGAQITMVNLSDYTILDCTGCTACTMAMSQGKNAGCVLDKKDDKKRIMDVMLRLRPASLKLSARSNAEPVLRGSLPSAAPHVPGSPWRLNPCRQPCLPQT